MSANPTGTVIDCAGRPLDLSAPRVMGILNVTPDSFSDGGQLFSGAVLAAELCRRAEAMVEAGAAVLDVGGESTRPGAAPVSRQQEMDRVLPAVERLCARFDVIVSVDTSDPEVMREAAGLGAGMINDVRALAREGALAAAAATGLPVALMHMRGEPGTMQQQTSYADVVAEVLAFLRARVDTCVSAGISRGRLLIDPGFGFGKTAAQNFELLRHLDVLADFGLPLLVGLSRKSMIASVIDRPVAERMPASVTLAVLAAVSGARLLRVHDVRATADALAMLAATRGEGV